MKRTNQSERSTSATVTGISDSVIQSEGDDTITVIVSGSRPINQDVPPAATSEELGATEDGMMDVANGSFPTFVVATSDRPTN